MVADANSLVPSDLARPPWDAIFPSRRVRTTALIDATSGYGEVCHVNPLEDAPALGAKISAFAVPAGCAQLLAVMPMRLAPGKSATTITVALLDAAGITVPGASHSFDLAATWADYAFSPTVTPGAEMLLSIAMNDGAQKQFLAGPTRVTPAGIGGVFAADFRRFDAAADLFWDSIPSESTLPDNDRRSRTASQSPGSRLVFDTDALRVTVEVAAEVFSLGPQYARFVILVDGRLAAVREATTASLSYLDVLLVPGKKRLEIVSGPQIWLGPLKFCGIRGVYFSGGSDTQAVPPPRPVRRLVVYGDSIAGGLNADYATFQGWATLLRRRYPGSVVTEAYGSLALWQDGQTDAQRATVARRLANALPSELWIALGTNDYGLVRWTAVEFEAAYADLLDRFHALSPGTRVYCQSPIVRAAPQSEAANSLGCALSEYRMAVGAVAAARPWAVSVDGAGLLTAADMSGDGLHPSISGHAKMAGLVANALRM